MAEFLTASELNLELENLIREAKRNIILISPYIKLHDRLKDELKRKKDLHDLQICLVFGKNETDVSKSIGSLDLDFFTSFPNVKIYYEKNLHAKYYANEYIGIITSMNLHQFSQNSNIEAGVVYEHKGAIDRLTNSLVNKITGNQDIGDKMWSYFNEIIDNSEKVFIKTPEYESKMLGIAKKYKSSKEEVNRIAEFFGNKSFRNDSALLRNTDQLTSLSSVNKEAVAKVMNIYQMYVSNDYHLGFFIRRDSWSNIIAKVISIEGIENGHPIIGQPPYYGNPSVMAEFYKANEPQECYESNFIEIRPIGTPGSYVYTMM